MTADEFWSATIAQLAALLPPAPAVSAAQGTGADLLALAGATRR